MAMQIDSQPTDGSDLHGRHPFSIKVKSNKALGKLGVKRNKL